MRGPRIVAILLAAALPLPTSAQLISVRTVPLPRGHQFDFFPSATAAMGGASLALGDSLLDPFLNPAKGARLSAFTAFATPSVYRVTSGAGLGQTLPVGIAGRAGDWFGAMVLATQQIDLSERFSADFARRCPLCAAAAISPATTKPANRYLHLVAGRRFPDQGLALGVSLAANDLGWLHGVDLLYAGSQSIAQRGSGLDLRLGALKEWESGRSFAATVVHNRYASTHDVLFLDPVWDPGAERLDLSPRLDVNLDRTRVWGLQLEYRQPIPRSEWEIGLVAGGNRLSHPKIPNYVLQSLPRDPGYSNAFRLGLGAAKRTPDSRTAIELIVEPIRSHTWGEAEGAITTASGGVIPNGGHTVDNRFRYFDYTVRAGYAKDIPTGSRPDGLTLQLGVGAHRVGYTLTQIDFLNHTDRQLRQAWIEWTPTWGATVRLGGVELQYRGSASATRIANLFDLSGLGGGGDDVTVLDPGPATVAAPSGPFDMDRLRVTTHQLAISVPLSGKRGAGR
ncbi:MAG: hypothetical protein R2909_02820 [Gemmatimonadales bacterium]